MTTMRSLLRERNTARWMLRYLQRLKNFLFKRLSPRAFFAEILFDATVGRMRTPVLRARLIEVYALFSEVGLHTTRTREPRRLFAAEVRLRAFGTLPPVPPLTDLSTPASGQ